MRTTYAWSFLVALCLCLSPIFPVSAAPDKPASWELAYKRGLKAARKQDWEKAIKRLTVAFDEAGPNSNYGGVSR